MGRRPGLGGWHWLWRDPNRHLRVTADRLRSSHRIWSRPRWCDSTGGRWLRARRRVLQDFGVEWLEEFRWMSCGRRRPGRYGRCGPCWGRLVANMLLVSLKWHPLAMRHLPQVDPTPAVFARSAIAGHRPPAQSGVPPMVAKLQAVVIICSTGCREAFFGVAPVLKLVDCAA